MITAMAIPALAPAVRPEVEGWGENVDEEERGVADVDVEAKEGNIVGDEAVLLLREVEGRKEGVVEATTAGWLATDPIGVACEANMLEAVS